MIARNWIYFCLSTVHRFLVMAPKKKSNDSYKRSEAVFRYSFICSPENSRKDLDKYLIVFWMEDHFKKCSIII